MENRSSSGLPGCQLSVVGFALAGGALRLDLLSSLGRTVIGWRLPSSVLSWLMMPWWWEFRFHAGEEAGGRAGSVHDTVLAESRALTAGVFEQGQMVYATW